MHKVLPVVLNLRDDLCCSLKDAGPRKHVSMLGRFSQISVTTSGKKSSVLLHSYSLKAKETSLEKFNCELLMDLYVKQPDTF